MVSSTYSYSIFRRVVIITFFAFVSFNFLGAEAPEHSDPGRQLDLQSLIERAENRSELLRSKILAVSAGEARLDQAIAWQNPFVETSFGQVSSDGKSGSGVEVRIFQPFYFPGKSGRRRDVFQAAVDQARSDAEEFRLFVRYEVVRLAYGLAATEEIKKHLGDRVARMRLLHAYLGSRPFASPQKIAEKLLVERKLERIESSMRGINLAADVFQSQLNFFVDLPEKIEVSLPWFVNGPELDRDSLISGALIANKTLERSRISVREREAELSLAQSEAYPDFGVSAIYRDGGSVGERYFGAGFTIPIPVFNRNQHAIRAFESDVQIARNQFQYETRSIRRQIEAGFAEYSTARMNLRAFPVGRLTQIDASMNRIDQDFLKSRVELLTFLELENETHEAHLLIFNAQVEFLEKYINLLTIASSRDFQVE